MEEIEINTKIALSVAEELINYNKSIDNEFEKVKNAMYMLNHNWQGAAAEAANEKYNAIKNEYVENHTTRRANVINNYANFLKEVVGKGYEKTEKTNTDLAAAFK